jgi:hypothetical protein
MNKMNKFIALGLCGIMLTSNAFVTKASTVTYNPEQIVLNTNEGRLILDVNETSKEIIVKQVDQNGSTISQSIYDKSTNKIIELDKNKNQTTLNLSDIIEISKVDNTDSYAAPSGYDLLGTHKMLTAEMPGKMYNMKVSHKRIYDGQTTYTIKSGAYKVTSLVVGIVGGLALGSTLGSVIANDIVMELVSAGFGAIVDAIITMKIGVTLAAKQYTHSFYAEDSASPSKYNVTFNDGKEFIINDISAGSFSNKTYTEGTVKKHYTAGGNTRSVLLYKLFTQAYGEPGNEI